jgi:hypothetical protein
MTRPRMLAHLKWALPVAAVLGLALGGRESRRYLLAWQNGSCSTATLHGNYDWAEGGLVKAANADRNILSFGPTVEGTLSYASFDGTGTVTSIITTHRFSRGSSFVVTRTGTYMVKQDCTGEITWDTSTNGPQAVAVNPDGRKVDFTNPSTEITATGTTTTQ